MTFEPVATDATDKSIVEPVVEPTAIIVADIEAIVRTEIYKQHGLRTESYVEDWISENLGVLDSQQNQYLAHDLQYDKDYVLEILNQLKVIVKAM